MRTKKLISMLLLPAAFVACTDDFVEDGGYAGNKLQKDAIEDYVLSVNFNNDQLSRAAYAGDSTDNPYTNFYLEPKYDENGDIVLGNQQTLKGDMMGYCLTSGANAITNLPFYIAGYGTAKDSVVYAFEKQEDETSLYYLGLTDKDVKVATADEIKASIEAIKNEPALSDDLMDVRKGIVRTNAGIMTGDYIAYFPYQASFTEPGGIPAIAMKDLYEVESLSDTRQEALAAVNFYDYLFAVSQAPNQVKGGTKSGDVSLKALSNGWTFKLVYTAEIEEGEDATTDSIKRITVKTVEEGAAGFTLEGKVALNSLGAITATKSTDLIGVSFGIAELDTATVKYVTVPFYANPAVTGYVIEVYNTKGQVATIEKADAKLELGKGYITTIDFKDLDFTNTTRKIFSEQDFVEEAVSGGDLQLMADIVVDEDVTVDADKPLNIKGAKKLTLTAGTYNSKLTMAAGSHLVLNGAEVADISADTLSVTANTDFGGNAIEALTFNNNGVTVELKNADIEVLNNNEAILYVEPVKAVGATPGTAVTINKLNSNGAVEFKGTATPYVKELNLLNCGNATVAKSLKADVVNIAAKVVDNPSTKGVDETLAAASMYVKGALNADAVINNGGNLYYYADINSTINNETAGYVYLYDGVDYNGTLNNGGKVVVTGAVEGSAGEVNNNENGVIVIQTNGYFGFTTTKLNINAGQVQVMGKINGNSNITVAEGAEFIATAENENVLLSTLGTDFINAKYTGIIVSTTAWPGSVTATSKKIYLKNNITFSGNTALNGGLKVLGNCKIEASGKTLTISDVTINAGAGLTIGEKTNVTVNGNITNNGTYEQDASAVVWCAGIAGTGTWTNKPNY